MMMRKRFRIASIAVVGALALGLATPALAAKLEEARICIECNETDNNLVFHIVLDGEEWKVLKIVNPGGRVIFEVEGRGPYAKSGMTELFFEGAEPRSMRSRSTSCWRCYPKAGTGSSARLCTWRPSQARPGSRTRFRPARPCSRRW